MAGQKIEIIANQVFIGCPWKNVKTKYEHVIDSFVKEYPISFVMVGREENQDAQDLLSIIKTKLITSSYAIFDATGGNANVSLEYGFAEAQNIPRALYTCENKLSKKATAESPIISDLAGKKRNIYKTEPSLKKLMRSAAENHNYTKRFKRIVSADYAGLSLGLKKRKKALALKIVHSLDNVDKVRRDDVIENLMSQNYEEHEAAKMITTLHKGKLIFSSQGRYSFLSMVEK